MNDLRIEPTPKIVIEVKPLFEKNVQQQKVGRPTTKGGTPMK